MFMREHTKTGEKTAPRSFTLTDEQHARMRDHAGREGITASALLRRWIAMHVDSDGDIEVGHLSPWGGNPIATATERTHGRLAPFVRMGKCNPNAMDYKGDPCALCWPNGTPNALRDARSNIVSWSYTEESE